jgi:hypothetical protein
VHGDEQENNGRRAQECVRGHIDIGEGVNGVEVHERLLLLNMFKIRIFASLAENKIKMNMFKTFARFERRGKRTERRASSGIAGQGRGGNW